MVAKEFMWFTMTRCKYQCGPFEGIDANLKNKLE